MAQPAGVSFAGALSGHTQESGRSLFFQFHDHWAIIRDNMKLVVAWSRPMELYDLSIDRAETTNLAEEQADLARSDVRTNGWSGPNPVTSSWNQRRIFRTSRSMFPILLLQRRQVSLPTDRIVVGVRETDATFVVDAGPGSMRNDVGSAPAIRRVAARAMDDSFIVDGDVTTSHG